MEQVCRAYTVPGLPCACNILPGTMAALRKIDAIQDQIGSAAYEVLERHYIFLLYLQRHNRKDARVAEEARLESV